MHSLAPSTPVGPPLHPVWITGVPSLCTVNPSPVVLSASCSTSTSEIVISEVAPRLEDAAIRWRASVSAVASLPAAAMELAPTVVAWSTALTLNSRNPPSIMANRTKKNTGATRANSTIPWPR